MNQKIIVYFCAMFIISQVEINTASNQLFSDAITEQFRSAVLKRDQEHCLLMLNQPKTVAQINFNAVGLQGYTLWCEVIKENGCLEDVVLKILELRTEDNGLVVNINDQHPYWKTTPLMNAILDFQPRLILQILRFRKSNGSLLVNINLKDYGNSSALKRIVDRWYYETTRCTGKNDANRKLWYVLIIKKLLLLGSNTTNIHIKGSLEDFILNKTPMQLLAQCSSQPHKDILLIFDALKPNIDVKKLTMQESMIAEAYQEFLEGKHDELRNQLLVLPDTMRRKGLSTDPFTAPLRAIFKPESIKPLLIFLAEKQYQRNMVDMIAS